MGMERSLAHTPPTAKSKRGPTGWLPFHPLPSIGQAGEEPRREPMIDTDDFRASWQQEYPLAVSQAIAAAIINGVFLGAEVRHITRDQDGFFSGHALFVGPSLFVKVSDDISFKVG
jgi:hypothetical protein